MSDLILELKQKCEILDKALGQLGNRGRAYAQAEREYRCALAKQILIERDNGIPVTIISDICRGKDDIAILKYDRDVADAMYKSALEGINVLKIQIRVLGGQIDREYRG